MNVSVLAARGRDNPWISGVVLAGAVLIAVVSARASVGAWNDGSRLATVECLVDQHTLAIDRSAFTEATADKLWINGHFYSDKSPVPALLLAVVYQSWQWTTGLRAADNPAAFCWLLTLASSGLAYVVAVWCVYRFGRPLRLPLPSRLLLTVSFAVATVAVVYTRHVNNHVLLLGVAAALMLNLARLATAAAVPRRALLLTIGSLAGLGYTIDLGLGPILLVCTLALVTYRCRRLQAVLTFGLAALPWLLVHHAVNYATGGTFKPANANPEYFLWPGCPFTPQSMTGGWNHQGPGHFLLYAAALLLGKHGFLGHNLPLFLLLPGLIVLFRRRVAEWPELMFAVCWSGGSWLAYAANSTNYSGLCCSIRWFVPLLVPGYLVLTVLVRERPEYRRDLLILSGWGAVLIAVAWWYGPWVSLAQSPDRHWLVPFFWSVQGAALVSWLVCALRRRRNPWRSHVASRPRARAA